MVERYYQREVRIIPLKLSKIPHTCMTSYTRQFNFLIREFEADIIRISVDIASRSLLPSSASFFLPFFHRVSAKQISRTVVSKYASICRRESRARHAVENAERVGPYTRCYPP